MKNHFFIKIFIFLCAMLCIIGCSSNQEKPADMDADTNFVADFDPVFLGDTVCLYSIPMHSPKPCEIALHFNPRDSSILAFFKCSVNKVCLIYSTEDQDVLRESVTAYMDLYNNDNFDPEHKHSKGKSFNSGNVDLLWGTLGYSRNVTAPTFYDYEYYNNNPYFIVEYKDTPYADEEHVFSPNITLYFSPNQLEKLYETTDYSKIMEQINAKMEEAYSFD